MTHTYGPPCFMNGSTRCLTVTQKGDKFTVYFKTTAFQAIYEGEGDVNETIVEVFEQKMKSMSKEDKRLFKTYFDKL